MTPLHARSSAHSVKGLEWDAVHLIAAYDGNFPADMSTGTEGIVEEWRLFYVALTRARRKLHVYLPGAVGCSSSPGSYSVSPFSTAIAKREDTMTRTVA